MYTSHHRLLVGAPSVENLIAVCYRLLRDRFLTMEEEEDVEEPRLSLIQMTGSLTRGQAAKLFYQICGKSPSSVHLDDET